MYRKGEEKKEMLLDQQIGTLSLSLSLTLVRDDLHVVFFLLVHLPPAGREHLLVVPALVAGPQVGLQGARV